MTQDLAVVDRTEFVAPEHAVENPIVIEFGNTRPQNTALAPDGVTKIPVDADFLGPSITKLVIPHPYTFNPNVDTDAFKRQLADAMLDRDGTTNGLDEALLVTLHPSGMWRQHSAEKKPSWVHCSTHPEFAEAISRYHGGVPIGRPDGVWDTHWSQYGPPGAIPDPMRELEMLLVNCGRDQWARMMGGGANLGWFGTASSAPTTTTMTDNTAAWTTNEWAGQIVSCGEAYGVILSNTATVLTVDQWYSAKAPGGAATGTPANGATYVINVGGPPAFFGWLSSSSVAPVSTDTSITSAITTAGGGLVPKICPYAHSAGTNTFTLTPVYTANGTDVLPVTVYQAAFCSSINNAVAATIVWKSCINVNAVMGAVGDQLTLTETITGT